MAELCDHQPFIGRVPVALAFCADCQRRLDAYREAGIDARHLGMGDALLSVADAVIAAQNVVVAAKSIGVGSCYIGDILENCELVRPLLGLPEYVFPAVMLVLGRPTKQQRERQKPQRFEKDHIVLQNHYQRLTGLELRNMILKKVNINDYDDGLPPSVGENTKTAFPWR